MTSLGLKTYTYRPLETDEIRLVEIAELSTSGELRCDLVHHKLTDDLRFDTLSYAWGLPDFDQVLIIRPSHAGDNAFSESSSDFGSPDNRDGCAFLRITSTLHSALIRVQRQKSGQQTLIWADALSIDQNNLAEKNAQVQLMRRIYGSAETTWIDLGEEENGSALVPRVVDHVLKNWEEISGYPAGLEITLLRWETADSSEFKALNAFIQRPWFSRVWIIQEAALARKPIMLCGDWSMPLDDLTKALSRSLLPARLADGFEFGEADLAARRQLSSLRTIRGYAQESVPMDLMGLMKNARFSQATQPIDRMFSMLGLSSDRDALELVAKYDELPIDTLKRYARYFVTKENKDQSHSKYRSIEILHFVSHSTWQEDQPTWIPSWTLYVPNNECIWESTTNCPHHASCRLPQATRLLEDPETNVFWLGAKGILVSEINELGKDKRHLNQFIAPQDGLSAKIIADLREQIIKPHELARGQPRSLEMYKTEEELQMACQSTLRGGRPKAETTQGEFDFDRCCTIILRDYEPWDLDSDEIWHHYWRSMALTVANIMTNNNWSVIAMLADGRLGRVPHGAQSGDRVVLLTGGQLPFLLRPVTKPEGGYQVVGPCYVYGIMDGELDHRHIEENLVEFILI